MRYILFISIILFSKAAKAQTIFLDKGEVIYEVKTNIKKTMGSGFWSEQMAEKLPDFKTAEYKFTFNEDASMYSFSKWTQGTTMPEWFRKDDEAYKCYTNIKAGVQQRVKQMFGTEFNVEDSIKKIEWRLSSENREIAGFNCRKAIGVINDSVYVFAFFTNEITFSGGPAVFNGLPGLILGVTIPRLHTSWVAKTVQVNGVKFDDLKPMNFKKPFNQRTMLQAVKKSTSDWFDSSDAETKKEMELMYWRLTL